jgi:lysyl-tRNA synthetase, class I
VRFLDTFGFDYEFQSSTDVLPVGPVRRVLLTGCWSASMPIMAIMLPTLRRGAAGDLFPFLPISPAHRPRAARCR